MKNIELFDKLSIRLCNRILFVKDVTGSEEICCWSFYGNGQKMAEVCCTSIVYATERKHNKVRDDVVPSLITLRSSSSLGRVFRGENLRRNAEHSFVRESKRARR